MARVGRDEISRVLTTLDRFLTPPILLSLLLYPPFAFAALFTFDAPGSTDNGYAHMFASGVLLYGPAVVATQIARRILRRNGRLAAAAVAGLLPLGLLAQAAVGIALIQAVCDGSFVCR